MPTTTNYGWTTPADTDLVKDGASAIRTLGTAIDTTTKNLNPSTTLGDIEYRSSTANTNTRLGIGSTGQVLTVAGGVPSWAALPAGGGMTLLTTMTLSGSSVTSSTFSSSYKKLEMYIFGAYASAAGGLRMRLNADTGTNYLREGSSAEGSSVYASGGTATSFQDILFIGSASGTLEQLHGQITVRDPSSTTSVFMDAVGVSYDGSIYRRLHYSGIYDNSAAITSVTFLLNSGTFTAGTVQIYGVN